MIDTIALTIPKESFSISDHNKFNPSTSNLFNPNFYRLGSRSYFFCVQNPTKIEIETGNYKPRLTITKRMKNGKFIITLKIEFSIPKLLFGNNFEEVEETDYKAIILLLHDKLTDMGVSISYSNIDEAKVSAAHFSKNISLTDFTTPYHILKELSKIDLNQKTDINKTDYRNEGHCLKFHSNNFEIAFYDKLKDLAKAKISEKRAIEKENSIQFDLFRKNRKPLEVIRMEVRLNNRTKLKRTLKEIDVKNDLTLHSIFDKSLSQKILLYYYSMIEKSSSLLAFKPDNTSDFIAELKILNPKVKIRKLLQILGFKIVIEEMGVRDFREFLKIFDIDNWYRLKKEYSTLIFPTHKSDKLSIIKNALIDFQPIKLSKSLNINLQYPN